MRVEDAKRTSKIQDGEAMTRTMLKMKRLIRIMPLEEMFARNLIQT